MHALRVIEWESVQVLLAAECETPLGHDAARVILPKFSAIEVSFEIDRTAEADVLLARGPVSLSGLKDVAGPLRIAEKGGVIDGAVLYAVGSSLRAMRAVRDILEPNSTDMPLLWQLGVRFPELSRLEDKLLASLDGDGYVRDEASSELGTLRGKIGRVNQRILERIQSYVSGRTRELLSDAVVTQRDGRYVIPLKAENKGKIRGIVHDTSASGSTVYIEPEDVVALGSELRQAQAAERAEVERILRDLSERVGAESPAIRDGLDAAGELDLILAKARLGRTMGGCLPNKASGSSLKLVEARHPLIDRSVCVPLSLEIGEGTDVLLITGPNTGGKTVAIKTVGLCAAMAQCGMMPPARLIRIGCFSQFWADIGDEQSLQQSLSTFSGHVKNIAGALSALKPDSLVLLDEVGAGTDPAEGAALARALLLAFQAGGAKVMASTHYGELKLLAANSPGFMNASMEFDLKSLRPTYRLLVGVPGSSHAMKIAERYGVPSAVIEEASQGVTSADLDVANMIEKLATAQKQAQRAQSEADRLTARLRDVEQEAEAKIAKAEETRRNVRERAGEELEALLREIRIEATDIFDALKKDPSQAGFDKARQRLKQLQEVGQDFVRETKPQPVSRPAVSTPQLSFKKGTTVRIAGLGQTGIVLEDPKDGRVLVQAGALKMTCKTKDLEPLEVPPSKAPKAKTSSMAVSKAMSASTEIHLRNMRAEDAQIELDRFLDDAVLGGVPSVRIVHGKGEGILRKLTQDALRRHRDVRSFRSGEPEEGGEGVTIAFLK